MQKKLPFSFTVRGYHVSEEGLLQAEVSTSCGDALVAVGEATRTPGDVVGATLAQLATAIAARFELTKETEMVLDEWTKVRRVPTPS